MVRTIVLALASSSVLVFASGCTSSQVNAADGTSAPSASRSAARQRSECPNFKDVAVKQQTPVWCWAASAEMVHRYYGQTDITQEQLARQITNASKDDPKKQRAAGLQEIMVALNPDFRKRVGEHSAQMLSTGLTSGGRPSVDYVDVALGQTAQWSASSDELVDAIASQNPVIVGLRGEGQSMGHAVVVYASSYAPVKDQESKRFMSDVLGAVAKDAAGRRGIRDDQVDAAGVAKGPAKWTLEEVEYVDPMDGRRYKLNAQGFKNRVDFIMTKDKAREILDRQLNAVR